jgi:transposase InsO family protein
MANPHYNKRSLLTRLNNYNYSPEAVEEVKQFLLNSRFPNGLTNSQKWKFSNRWKWFEWKSNHLYYKPLNLEVITDFQEKEDKMRELFNDLSTSLGHGKRLFYYEVVNKYLNITRDEVANFLDKQKLYQVTRPSFHKTNKPIIVTKKNERWSIDLIDISHYESTNNGFNYILTCIDNLTRRAFARPLKHKSAVDVRNAFESICQEAGEFPKMIHSDQGPEFRAEFEEWLKQNGIRFIKSKTYSPQSNGLIEGFNAQLRKMIREVMIRFNTTDWISHLQSCIEAHNNKRNSTIKAKPIDIWNAPNTDEAAKNIKERAKREVAKNKTLELHIGDLVRIKLTALHSKMRRLVKQNDKKKLVALWSPEIYKVKSIVNPDYEEGLEKKRYTIETMNGNNVVKAGNEPMRFFATDFLKVQPDELQDGLIKPHFSNADAMALNYNKKRRTRVPREIRETRGVETRHSGVKTGVTTRNSGVTTRATTRATREEPTTSRRVTRGVRTHFDPNSHTIIGGEIYLVNFSKNKNI